MATYTKIASNVLTSDTSIVSFSSIPATYTDLIFKLMVRSTDPSFSNDVMRMQFNNYNSGSYYTTFLRGDQDGVSGSTGVNSTSQLIAYVNAGTSTPNTFTNIDVYVGRYAGSEMKQTGAFAGSENDSANAYRTISASRFEQTTPITIATFRFPTSGYSFAAGSSFYLYGISNA